MLESASLLISFALLILSVMQYQESKEDRIESSQALHIAKQYENQSRSIYNSVDSISKQINKVSLLTLQNQYFIANNSFLALNSSKGTKLFESNADTILRMILLDSIFIRNWVYKNIK